MQIDALKDFSLVGGTALSLLYGHRISVDLDVFSTEKFDNAIIEQTLLEAFGDSFTYEGIHPNFGIFCYINEVKVDIVHYPHKTLTCTSKY